MSLQKAGSNLDNTLATKLDGATTEYVRAIPWRGSGNTGQPAGDVVVTTPRPCHVIESKRCSWDTGDRRQLLQREDLRQLYECINTYTDVWVAWQMTRRQLCVVGPLSAEIATDPVTSLAMSVQRMAPDPFDVTATASDHVMATKPDTDAWPSKTSGRSQTDVLIDELGLDDYRTDEP
jgi:Holliday junction resolvase